MNKVFDFHRLAMVLRTYFFQLDNASQRKTIAKR